MMNRYAETVNVTSGRSNDSCNLGKPVPKPKMNKETWIEHYAGRMLKLWLQWQTPLGVSCDYVRQLEKDLANFYEKPLKRVFIETTY
ncbi:MAG: hypothetical protein ACYS30_10595 [Planctomycetota bacterium]|jgi:hypothetical protein